VEHRPLLITKVMPPVRRSEAVVRTRLHARIREGADRALTLLAAGPGFGKSTLLTAWREEELSSRSVAWLTLAEGENDPVALCGYIVEAIRAARPGFGGEVQAALETPAPPLEDALPRLVDELVAGDSLALVLDDFHRVTSRDAQLVVGWLAENSPRALSSRRTRWLRSSTRQRAGRPGSIVIQRQLGHTNLGITWIYLQGIDSTEIIDTVHARRPPMVPVDATLRP
jgi:ATP/maltotriose-dependent transcriptional regulator MalT